MLVLALEFSRAERTRRPTVTAGVWSRTGRAAAELLTRGGGGIAGYDRHGRSLKTEEREPTPPAGANAEPDGFPPKREGVRSLPACR